MNLSEHAVSMGDVDSDTDGEVADDKVIGRAFMYLNYHYRTTLDSSTFFYRRKNKPSRWSGH